MWRWRRIYNLSKETTECSRRKQVAMWEKVRCFGMICLLSYLLTYLLTYLRTYSLTDSQLVKKVPPFHGTRRFITVLTSARHLSLSWVGSIQSLPPPTSWRSILILSMLGSSTWSVSLRFPHQTSVYTSPLSHTCYVPHPSHSSRFDNPNKIWWEVHLVHCIETSYIPRLTQFQGAQFQTCEILR